MDERNIIYQTLHRTQKELHLYCEKKCCVCTQSGLKTYQYNERQRNSEFLHFTELIDMQSSEMIYCIEKDIQHPMKNMWQNDSSNSLCQQYLYPKAENSLKLLQHNTAQHRVIPAYHNSFSPNCCAHFIGLRVINFYFAQCTIVQVFVTCSQTKL